MFKMKNDRLRRERREKMKATKFFLSLLYPGKETAQHEIAWKKFFPER